MPRPCRGQVRIFANERHIFQPLADDTDNSLQEAFGVGAFTLIETERLFVQITKQMKRFNTNIGAANATLEQAPEVFHAVRVDIAANIFAGVVNRFMNIVRVQAIIGAKRVGVNVRSGFNVLANLALYRGAFRIFDMLHADLAAALKQAHDNLLAAPSASAGKLGALHGVHLTDTTTDVSFVRFHVARKLVHAVVLNGQPDAVKHEPSGFLGDTQGAGQFARAYPVFGVHNHPEGREPFVQSKGAILENRTNLDGELLGALFALPNTAGAQKRCFGGLAARAFGFAIRPADRRYEVQGGVGIGEVLDGVGQRLRKLGCALVHAYKLPKPAVVSQVYNHLNLA